MTKAWRRTVLSISAFAALAAAQTAPNPNSDFFNAPDSSIDFPGCFSDLVTADVNNDGLVTSNEYLGFIQEYGQRKCIENPVLTFQQRIAFNNIACQCRSEQGAASNCCIGANAQIRTAGALDPARTGEQLAYLTSACRITDATLPPFNCPPEDGVRGNAPLPPLPPIFIPPAPRGGGGGLSDAVFWTLIAAAALLLLMLLLCCCVCAKRRGDEEESSSSSEEEDDDEEKGGGIPPKVLPSHEDVEDPEPDVLVPPAKPQQLPSEELLVEEEIEEIEEEEMEEEEEIIEEEEEEEESDEDEEEGRKRAGGGPLGDEDEVGGHKRYGAGRFPPPESDKPGLKLRPIEKEEEEDPDWDHPGRAIHEPRTKGTDVAQTFVPYNPDGGVFLPQRPDQNVVEYDPQWERGEKEEPDDTDKRKHRIQSGLGEGAVWDQLDADESESGAGGGVGTSVFDWVVQSALGVLDRTDESYLTGNNKDEDATKK